MRHGRIALGLVSLLGLVPTAGVVAGSPARTTPATSSADRFWETRPPGDAAARRRWALARMDEASREIARCRERLRLPRLIEECERIHTRRYRQYNEVYIEAARE